MQVPTTIFISYKALDVLMQRSSDNIPQKKIKEKIIDENQTLKKCHISSSFTECQMKRLQIKYKTLEINYSAHTLKIDNKIVNITPKEYEILNYLIDNKNIAISREQLLSNIWGYDFFGEDRTVDTHIKMLRGNLGKYRDNIVTVRGVGYKYVEEEE